jgi:hypothetical protein
MVPLSMSPTLLTTTMAVITRHQHLLSPGGGLSTMMMMKCRYRPQRLPRRYKRKYLQLLPLLSQADSHPFLVVSELLLRLALQA